MANNLYLVFSQRPSRVSAENYDRWYAQHAQENIESPGFLNAQRYTLREVDAGEEVGPEWHLAVYEYEGEMSVWRKDLSHRIETGDVDLPEWFRDITFKSWNGRPIGGLLTPQR
jgi:hypothetical protein